MDTQSIPAANHIPALTTGKNTSRKASDRKRGLAGNGLSPIIAVVVTATSVTDNAIGIRLLGKLVEHTPTVTVTRVDVGLNQDDGMHGATGSIDVEGLIWADQVRSPDVRGRSPPPVADSLFLAGVDEPEANYSDGIATGIAVTALLRCLIGRRVRPGQVAWSDRRGEFGERGGDA